MSLALHVYDSAWVRIGSIRGGEFDAVIRRNAPGEWSYFGLSAAFSIGDGDPSTVRGIVLHRDTQPIATFHVGDSRDIRGRIELVDTPTGTGVEAQGVDGWATLGDRLTYPTPATEPPWVDPYHVVAARPAADVAATYIADHLATPPLAARAPTDRAISVTSTGAGTELTWRTRLDNLGDVVADVCAAGGVEALCSPNGSDGDIRFTVAAPVDRSAEIVYTETDAETVRVARTVDGASAVIGAGSGELTDRLFVSSIDGAATRRVERLYDYPNLETASTLQAGADGVRTSLEGGTSIAVELAADRYQWRTDYQVGDLVTFRYSGVNYVLPVTAVRIRVIAGSDGSGGVERITPVLGSGIVNDVGRLVDQVAALESSFGLRVQ